MPEPEDSLQYLQQLKQQDFQQQYQFITNTGSLGSQIPPTAATIYSSNISYIPTVPPGLTIPVYDVTSKEGIFLRDEKGNLTYVPISRIAELVGKVW